MTIETIDLALPPDDQPQEHVSRVEAALSKLVLSSFTMLGVGYIMVNLPLMILLTYFWSTIPISSQANISAIAGKVMYLIASGVLAVLGVTTVFGGVKFFEGQSTKRVGFIAVLLASIYLLCLGIGSTLLLPQGSIEAVLLLAAPIMAIFGGAAYLVPERRFKFAGSLLGIVGGVLLAYAILNVHVWELAFDWGVSFSGPFMGVAALEAVTVTLVPVAAFMNALIGENGEGKPLAHAAALVVVLVYGIGVLVGSLVLSMSLWDLVWKSPWAGPLSTLPSWVISTVVFWSASLFLIDIGGIMLVITASLGFVLVAREFKVQ